MPRYIDSGSGRSNQSVGHWLDDNLIAGIRAFRCQFGYFRFAAIEPFSDLIHDVAGLNGAVHMVLGSNGGSLIAQDAQRALRVTDGINATLTVVSFSDAEFHPKTIHIVRADGTSTAVVGSSNLTGQGLGKNIEAGVIWDSRTDDPDELQAIADAIDRWRTLGADDGVFRIGSDADLQDLANEAIINVPQPVRQRARRDRGAAGRRLPRRTAAWEPTRDGWLPPVPALIPRPPEIEIIPEAAATASGAAFGEPPPATAIILKWCKRLDRSDAQRVRGHGTGKLRLGKARFPIDKNTWFRHDFFNTPWVQQRRHGQTLNETTVRFDVRVRGRSLHHLDLIIDHGEHRIADQGNVPTVLAWGTELNREMRATNHVGDWVVLTRDVNGRFGLTIQQHRPHWAP